MASRSNPQITQIKKYESAKPYGLNGVPEAIRYLEEGHTRGKVVITWECNNET